MINWWEGIDAGAEEARGDQEVESDHYDAHQAEALGREGIHLSTRQTREYLQKMGARWRRTVRTLGHKQDRERVERARVQFVLPPLPVLRVVIDNGSLHRSDPVKAALPRLAA